MPAPPPAWRDCAGWVKNERLDDRPFGPGCCTRDGYGIDERAAIYAGVAELVDALALGASGAIRGGSSPSARTILSGHPPIEAAVGGRAGTIR